MIPIWGYIGIGAALTGALGGWTVREWKADSDQLEAEQKAQTEYVAVVQALADQSLAYETIAQSLRASERTDRETIRTIYRDKIVPAVCDVPIDALRVLDNAVERANSAAPRQPSSALPSPSVAPR